MTIEDMYIDEVNARTDICEHLPTLRKLAASRAVVEQPDVLESYDRRVRK